MSFSFLKFAVRKLEKFRRILFKLKILSRFLRALYRVCRKHSQKHSQRTKQRKQRYYPASDKSVEKSRNKPQYQQIAPECIKAVSALHKLFVFFTQLRVILQILLQNNSPSRSSLFHRNVGALFGNTLVSRSYDLSGINKLLHAVSAPAGNSCDSEQRSIKLDRKTKH